MVPGELWKVVKEQRACFSCLKRGKSYASYNCSRRKACGKSRRDGTICKRPHHELLHETESVDALHVAFLQDSSKTILPVISSLTKGREGELVESNVFYDSGAQISLIWNAFNWDWKVSLLRTDRDHESWWSWGRAWHEVVQGAIVRRQQIWGAKCIFII